MSNNWWPFSKRPRPDNRRRLVSGGADDVCVTEHDTFVHVMFPRHSDSVVRSGGARGITAKVEDPAEVVFLDRGRPVRDTNRLQTGKQDRQSAD